jgi:hypothetical protein
LVIKRKPYTEYSLGWLHAIELQRTGCGGGLSQQLYDMQNGNRSGTWTPLMAAVVASLEADVLNLSVYIASLKP